MDWELPVVPPVCMGNEKTRSKSGYKWERENTRECPRIKRRALQSSLSALPMNEKDSPPSKCF